MQRLLIFLLIFLLPMQVFAGMSEFQANTQANVVAMLAYAVQQDDHQELKQATPACKADSADSADSDCSSQDSAVDDIEMHVDLGDETVPAVPLVFAAAAMASTPAPSNDKARQPPFLPPAGPPPRA
jgi:flagellar biosynthesis component FlhA